MNDSTIKAELKDLVYSLMIPLYDEMFINKDLSEKELLNKWHSLKEYYFKSIVTEATFTSIEKIIFKDL